MACKIKKGDEIIVIAGKDKKRRGAVLCVLTKVGGVARLIVEGVNTVKKHVKPNPNKGIEGGIVTKESSLDVSNVAIYNPVTKKADRIGFKTLEDGKKVRVFKSNSEVIGG